MTGFEPGSSARSYHCATATTLDILYFHLSFGKEFDEISDKAKSFITSTIVKKKEDRLDAEQCLEHPWLQR